MAWHHSASTDECVRTNLAGWQYEEFSCLYPQIPYMSWEIEYDPVPVRDWMKDHPWVPIAACSVYLAWCVLGQRYFHNRPAWNWRKLMALWNLGLSVFSLVGFSRTFPQVLHNAYHYNFVQNVTFDPESHYGSGATGLWVQLFILSKFPELLDTFFIVIHKKKLIFLHWYHHVSVLLYCWHSYCYKAPSGLYFCVMNYAVHSMMYFYYFLMAISMKPKWFRAHWLTIAQISQMVVGVALTLVGFALPASEHNYIKRENNVAAFVMYGSYLLLFLQFFFQRYQTKPIKTTKKVD